MSSISIQIFNFIDDDHKKLSLSKETNFKTFSNTYPNDLNFFSNIQFFMIYKIPKLQIQKNSNKGDMTKKPDLTQNLQKLITLTKQIFFFQNFENRNILQSYSISPSFTPRPFHNISRSRFKDLTSTTFDMWISSHLFLFFSFSSLLSFPHFSFALDKLL